MTAQPTLGDVDPDHLDVYASFFHLQVIIFLFLLICILWDSCLYMMVTKWWFFIPAILFTCISWHPAIRNSFPFLPFIYLIYLYQFKFINFIWSSGLSFTLMLKLFVIWPLGGLFLVLLTCLHHFLSISLLSDKKDFQTHCISSAPALESAILSGSLVSFSWEWYLDLM